jgi:DNA-binding Xre family transcriptional regulator
MSYNYNGLWKLLIDKNLKKKDLMEKANISSSTMAKMGKGLPVKLEVLSRICLVIECNIGDILEITNSGS